MAKFVLFDDARGVRTAINSTPCSQNNPLTGYEQVESFGAPWVLFQCTLGERLYNVVTRRWSRFRCTGACLGPRGSTRTAARIGARWVQLYFQLPGSCGDGVHDNCGPTEVRFMDLVTRRVRSATTGSRTIVDLDSPHLIMPACRPLRIPPQADVTVAGRYVLIDGPPGTYVQRCGSSREFQLLPVGVSIAGNFLINTGGVVWEATDRYGIWHGQIDGLQFPTMRRFTTHAPATANPTGFPFALDSRRLYLGNRTGKLLAAPFG